MKATKTVSSNNPGAAGAAPPPGPCSLRRPRFFRDQLLTDQDLCALTTWVQGKFGLGLFRHGWGVVCGLEVRCDPKSPGNVIVGPGYAIDGAGKDVVVPEDSVPFDLSATCLPQGGPCAPPAAAGPGAPEGTTFGVPAGDVTAFDLYIAYAETGADARHVPRRGACRDSSGCEYAREVEKYKLEVRAAGPEAPPSSDPNQAWPPGYEKWKQDAHTLVNDVSGLIGAKDLKKVREKLTAWIAQDRYPLYEFGFLADALANLQMDPEKVARLLYWLLQDGRARLLGCPCPAMVSDPAVLLARLWLQAKQDGQGRLSCQVIGIDSMPPHRRPLGPKPCWPAPPGQVNLARWIWLPYDNPDDLLAVLAEWQLGVPNDDPGKITPVSYAFGQGSDFDRVINAPLIVRRRTTFSEVKYFDTGKPLGKRIVAFLTEGNAASVQRG
jgi:hypothetical protein